MKIFVLLLTLCFTAWVDAQSTSAGFFGNFFGNIFRRQSETIYVPTTTTQHHTLFNTETVTATVTETETSTMSISWLRWTTETEREFITETVTETTTSVDVSLLVSVAVVTLTERSTSVMTTTETLMSTMMKTMYSELIFTETPSKCPTVTVSVQKKNRPPVKVQIKDILDIDDLDFPQHREDYVELRDSMDMKDVDIDDLDLVEGFLKRSTGPLISDTTALPRLPPLVKQSSYIESSFPSRQRQYYPATLSAHTMVTADLKFTD